MWQKEMFEIAVRVKNWEAAVAGFYEIARRINDEPDMNVHWLVYGKGIVGNRYCRVHFYPIKGKNTWIDHKYNVAMGFDMWEQKEILKEGCRASRKYVKIGKNYFDDIMNYFRKVNKEVNA